MEVSEARRLRALEGENARLKRIIADLSVQNHILKEVNAKKW
jgi:putative transposase